MVELQELEALPNWVATFERTSPQARERYECLMRNIFGGYYWHTPHYIGLFGWGATRTFHPDILLDDLRLGYKRLVRGELPPEIAEKLGEEMPDGNGAD